VLKSVDYRDADRVLTLLTERHGKTSVLARNARASRRRFGGALEPYALLEVEIGPGRGELGHIASSRIVRAFPRILADLRRMALAETGLELLRETASAETPDARTFATAVELLERLDAAESAREELLLAFEVRALALAGFAADLGTCVRCGTRAPEERAVTLDAALGGIVCRACGGASLRISGAARRVMARAVGSAWADVELEWEPRALAEVRRAVTALAEAHVGRPLGGRSVVAQVGELGS
jgi:DNA repair protein RecO (recombination protein O)